MKAKVVALLYARENIYGCFLHGSSVLITSHMLAHLIPRDNNVGIIIILFLHVGELTLQRG